MTVYIDLIFLENIFMNTIILYASALIIKKEIKIIRILASSVIGAIYACIYYISQLEIYSSVVLKLVLSFAMVYISFNSKTLKIFLKELLIFYLTSFTFGGVTFALLYFISPQDIMFQNGTLIGIYPMKMILVGGLVGFIIIVVSFKTIKNKVVKSDMKCKIEMQIYDKKIKLNAIIDTGNFLKEPITKKSVVIVEKSALEGLISTNILENLDNIIKGHIEIEEKYKSRIKLIPFSALGVENGLLVGINPDQFIIYYQDKKIRQDNVIIGIYNKSLSKSNRYNALVGLDIIENLTI